MTCRDVVPYEECLTQKKKRKKKNIRKKERFTKINVLFNKLKIENVRRKIFSWGKTDPIDLNCGSKN